MGLVRDELSINVDWRGNFKCFTSEWKVKEDSLSFNWIKDEGVYREPVMNGYNSSGKDVRCNLFIFCTFYIQLDVIRICMESN